MIKTRMKRVASIALPILVAFGLVVLFYLLSKDKQIDVLNPSGEVAQTQHTILMFTLFLSSLVVVPVFTMLIVFAVRYRASNNKAKYTPEWGENKVLESLWWGIPLLIIGVLGVITYQTSHSLDPRRVLSGSEPLQVQVVALRWKWLFIYPEQQVATLNYLPLPVNRPVTFSLTADAPMSAFWIPALGSQIYAMNGMESQLNLKALKVGSYTGYTTNINGEGYARMKFQTKVITEKDFSAWTAKAATSTTEMNIDEYTELVKPESITEERTYRVTDDEMFDEIMKKYGHNMHMEHAV